MTYKDGHFLLKLGRNGLQISVDLEFYPVHTIYYSPCKVNLAQVTFKKEIHLTYDKMHTRISSCRPSLSQCDATECNHSMDAFSMWSMNYDEHI